MADRDATVGGVIAPRTPDLQALADTELGRWEIACRATDTATHRPWPEAEARDLVAAVLHSVIDNDESGLEPAASAWASATASIPLLVSRLAVLRALLAETGQLPPETESRLAPVLDKAATWATQTAMSDLEDAALTDPLTETGNRRALEIAAKAALASAERTGKPLSVVVIDLDGLKIVNDSAGHAAGDRALAGLAAAVRSALRDTDQLFRIGGDEFVVLLPMAPFDSVPELMERAGHFNAPSFTYGVATTPTDGSDLETLLRIADSRLYALRSTRRTRPEWTPPARIRGGRRHLLRAALAALISVAAVLVFVLLVGTGNDPHPSSGTASGGLTPSTTANAPTAGVTGSGASGRSSSGSGDRSGTSSPGGSDPSGSSHSNGSAGTDSSGSATAGSSTAGSSTAGSSTAGSSTAGSSTAGSSTSGTAGSGSSASGGSSGSGGSTGSEAGGSELTIPTTLLVGLSAGATPSGSARTSTTPTTIPLAGVLSRLLG